MSNDKNTNTNTPQDKGLQENEKIEQAIAALQQEATQELLAHALTVIRRRMNENGQFNPWNRTIMLDKNLINIVLGNI